MFDGCWDQEVRRAAKLRWGGPQIPDWMIAFWKGYSKSRAEEEASLVAQMQANGGLEGYFHSTLINCNFRDLLRGSTYSGPFCRLYAFCDKTGRLFFADTIAAGEVVEGWASVKVRYRFKDLLQQAEMVRLH
jgi:hypothetical protein